MSEQRDRPGGDDELAGELKTLAAHVDEPVLAFDDEGTIAFANEAATDALGYGRETLRGEPAAFLLAADDSGVGSDVYTSAAFLPAVRDDEADDGVDVAVETATGRTRRLHLSPIDAGGDDTVVCLAEEHREPTVLEADAELVQHLGDPVYVLDADGRIERVNDAILEYTGYERTELLGRAIGEIIPSKEYDRTNRRLAELVEDEGAESETFETTLVTKEGELILTEANVTALTQDGSYAGSIGVLRDIRERKQRERDLELLKQVLTRVFRHNIRNKLMVVRGHAEIVDEQTDESVDRHTDKILETTKRLLGHSEKARRIEQVIENDDLYEHDIDGIVEEIVATARDEHPGAEIDVDVPAGSRVSAHPEIAKAIEELVRNAIEHAPEGESPRLSIWLDERDTHRTLFVEDESGGLADYEIEVLREGVESDLEHGSGVGLWLVRWLVEYSDADMIAHRTDEGSLMGIRFARPEGPAPGSEDSLAESPLARAPAHVREDISPERFRDDVVIGRMEALHDLEDTYDALERTGGHAVLVTGEAGIGKTTLVEQFRERLTQAEDTPLVANGSCESEVRPPYHAFQQVMEDLPVGTDLSELLADVTGLAADDPEAVQQRKQALFADIADELRELALDHPVVLIVEDMQWADRGTVDLFEYLVDEVGRWGHPVLFVGTYRVSDVGQAHPVLEIAEETAEAGRGTLLELEPFDRDDVRSLLSYMLDVEELPDEFVDAVYDHTGGTPLFVNEIGRHLTERLGPVERPAALVGSLEEVSMPDSVDSAVTERLEALPDQVRPVLRLGAVIGEEFSFDVLRAASDLPEGTLIDSVDSLVRRHVWLRSDGDLEFVHGVLREQALAALDEETRTTLHERVADAIEHVHAEHLEEHAGRLAGHYEQVGDYWTAFLYYRQAGDRAAETYAHEDAIEQYERALALAEDHDITDPTELAALRADLGRVLRTTGQIDEAREVIQEGLAVAPDHSRKACELLGIQARTQVAQSEFDQAAETSQRQRTLAVELDARDLEAEAITELGEIARSQGEYEQAREYYEQSIAIAREIDDRQNESKSINGLGVIATRQGEYEKAREYYEQSLDIKREIGDRLGEAKSLNNLGITAYFLGEYDGAREYYEGSLDIKREIGDRQGVASTLNNLGLVTQNQGEYEQAREYYEQALESKREIGDRKGEALSLNNLGLVARNQGEYEQAREYYEQSLEIRREIGDRQREATSLNNLGEVAKNQGKYDQAREYSEQSLAIRQELGHPQGEIESRNTLGIVAWNRGEYDQAREYYEGSLEIAREIGERRSEAWSLNGLGLIARSQNEYDQAQEHLDEALEIAREVGIPRQETICLYRRAALARKRAEYDRAREALDESLTAHEAVGDPRLLAKIHLEETRLALARDDAESAREAIQRASDLIATVGATHDEGRVRLLRGRIAAATGSDADAREHWEGALDIFESVGAPQDALATLQYLVETCREHDQQADAVGWCDRAREILERAPEPVVAQHEGWLDSHASALGVT